MTGLAYTAGVVGVLVGLWHLFAQHEEGHLDYYLSTVAGMLFILLIAMLIRWYLAPWVAVLSGRPRSGHGREVPAPGTRTQLCGVGHTSRYHRSQRI